MVSKGRKLRVAYIGIKGLPARGGAERVVEAIVKRMPALGVEPTVYCGTHYTPRGTKIDGVRLIRLPTVPGKYTRQTVLDLLQALHAVVLGNYDLIHIHHNEAGFVVPLLRLRYRVVGTCHGGVGTRKWGPIARLIMGAMAWPFMKLSNLVTFVACHEADEFGTRYKRRTVYIPNGVSADCEPDIDAARRIQAALGLRPREYFVLVAARILSIKGAHLAIEAINKLGGDIPLLIVGDEMQESSYGKTLHEMAGPNVVFHPPISDPALLFGLMADSKCLLFPSTFEAMSMVLLEAASVGTPILCSDIPQNTAVMGDDAVYFESGNVLSLSEKINWVITHEDEFLRIAERAQKRVHDNHCWDNIAEKYVKVYNEVVGGA